MGEGDNPAINHPLSTSFETILSSTYSPTPNLCSTFFEVEGGPNAPGFDPRGNRPPLPLTNPDLWLAQLLHTHTSFGRFDKIDVQPFTIFFFERASMIHFFYRCRKTRKLCTRFLKRRGSFFYISTTILRECCWVGWGWNRQQGVNTSQGMYFLYFCFPPSTRVGGLNYGPKLDPEVLYGAARH